MGRNGALIRRKMEPQKIASHNPPRQKHAEEGLDRLNCVVSFLCKRYRTSVGMAIGRHISVLLHHLPHLSCQPHSLQMQSTPLAVPLIGLGGVTNDLSGLSGGPLSWRYSGRHPVLSWSGSVKTYDCANLGTVLRGIRDDAS
jgi:hypothetical protein